MNTNNTEPKNGQLTKPTNLTNQELGELQLFLSQKIEALSDKEKLDIELFALKVKMEDHLNNQK